MFLFFRGPSEIVADFGCGEAVIAQSVPNTVHSFDLVAKNKHVTACNMAKVGASEKSDSSMYVCVSVCWQTLFHQFSVFKF